MYFLLCHQQKIQRRHLDEQQHLLGLAERSWIQQSRLPGPLVTPTVICAHCRLCIFRPTLQHQEKVHSSCEVKADDAERGNRSNWPQMRRRQRNATPRTLAQNDIISNHSSHYLMSQQFSCLNMLICSVFYAIGFIDF